MIGTSVDRYEILEELGHGGMSVVYRGMDGSLEREVAVKVLHNHLAKKLENRRRFHREAKAIARLRHRNILEIYDFSSEDAERSYIVMEYVAGENLRQLIARTGTPPPEAGALIAIEICNALEHAHDHGIIHRDLKPENIMVSEGGALKLMDFGIAHVIDAETMTATGSLMGSPAHMAPELIDGKPVDVRADVFALGTVLYWLVTGQLPFDGANAPQVLRKVLEGDFEDPETREPRVGKRLAEVIRNCLAHNPDDRYPSVIPVRNELQAIVASIGIKEPDEDIKKYFKAPEAYREEFEATVVEKLMALAREAQRERNVPKAIGLFNRILAYEPDNREVQRLLDQLCRQARWRRIAPWAVACIVMVAAVSGWLATRPEPAPMELDATTAPVPGLPTAPVNAVAERISESATAARKAWTSADENGRTASSLVRDRAVEIAEATERLEAPSVAVDSDRTSVITPDSVAADVPDVGTDAAAPDSEPPPSWKYRFSVSPLSAIFLVNGRRVDTMQAKLGIELEAGTHRLSATSKATKPWTDTIVVDGPQQKVKPVVLTWDDGRVRVVANKKAVVWLGKQKQFRRIGANGRNATFSFSFGPANSTERTKQITLRVAAYDDLANPSVRTVEVVPGTTHTVDFEFD